MSIHILPDSNYLTYLQTIARNSETDRENFRWATNRVNRLLLEYALSFVDYKSNQVTTPTNSLFSGLSLNKEICGVSIIRAGESMELSLIDIMPGVSIGKILIQRDKESLTPQFYYQKLPANIQDSIVLLLEPMLATGGSLTCAIDSLIKAGVPENQIISVNYLASPKGLKQVSEKYTECKFIVSSVENALNNQGFMSPGIGDFGDRYFE